MLIEGVRSFFVFLPLGYFIFTRSCKCAIGLSPVLVLSFVFYEGEHVAQIYLIIVMRISTVVLSGITEVHSK